VRGVQLSDADFRERDLAENLVPPEAEFDAIIVDALGGNDQVTVGPTVQKTVWIDAGAGDDKVVIRSGNAILVDGAEFVEQGEFVIGSSTLPDDLTVQAVFDVGLGMDTFRVTIDPPAAPAGIASLIADVNAALAQAVNNSTQVVEDLTDRIRAELIEDTNAGTRYLLLRGLNGTAFNTTAIVTATDAAGNDILELGLPATTVDSAGFVKRNDSPDFAYEVTGSSAQNALLDVSTILTGLTIDNPDDIDWYSFALANAPLAGARILLRSASSLDELTLSLFDASDPANSVGSATVQLSPDATDSGQSSDVIATAYELEQIESIAQVRGLSIDNAADIDVFSFVLANDGAAGDVFNLVKALSTDPITLELLNANGDVLASVATSDERVLSIDLEDLQAGEYFVRVSSTSLVRYELAPYRCGWARRRRPGRQANCQPRYQWIVGGHSVSCARRITQPDSDFLRSRVRSRGWECSRRAAKRQPG
jgi:hypothetical protein